MATLTSYDVGDDGAIDQDGSSVHVIQTFTLPFNSELSNIQVLIYRTGSPGTCSIGLYATDVNGEPTGSSLHSVGFNGNILTTDSAGEWKSLAFNDSLPVATKYAIRLSGGDNVSNKVSWRYDSTSAIYSGGERLHSTDSGASYTHYSDEDLMFRILGTAIFTPPFDIVTYKRLVAAANDKIYYEDI